MTLTFGHHTDNIYEFTSDIDINIIYNVQSAHALAVSHTLKEFHLQIFVDFADP